MTDKNTLGYLDLDEITQPTVRIKKGGVWHEMVPLSVLDFVKNVQDLKKLREGDLENEAHVVHGMLHRAFPSLSIDIIEKLTLQEVQAIQGVIQQAMQKAEGEGEEAAKSVAENPQPAAASDVSTSDISSAA